MGGRTAGARMIIEGWKESAHIDPVRVLFASPLRAPRAEQGGGLGRLVIEFRPLQGVDLEFRRELYAVNVRAAGAKAMHRAQVVVRGRVRERDPAVAVRVGPQPEEQLER